VFLGYFFAPAKKSLARLRAKALLFYTIESRDTKSLNSGFRRTDELRNIAIMSGYSGTPLTTKLGIKPESVVLAIHAPDNYRDLVGKTDAHFAMRLGKNISLVHLFTTSKIELSKSLKIYREKLAPDAVVWVSWPKKASKVPTDITEGTIRDIALPMGWVDIKVCAVDEVWSGLKLVVRKALR
jgi:hypothetical protein